MYKKLMITMLLLITGAMMAGCEVRYDPFADGGYRGDHHHSSDRGDRNHDREHEREHD